jgi:quercetin dioxygenase-like cupin family protein
MATATTRLPRDVNIVTSILSGMRRLFAALVVALVVPVGAQNAARDGAATTIEVDNAWTKAVRVRMAPREKGKVAWHLPSVIVYLTDGAERRRRSGRSDEVQVHKSGDVAYVDEGAYAVDNDATMPSERVVIELKTPPATKEPQPRVTLDPVALDPEHHPVLLENARVRVLRTILEPHLRSPMHEHPHYVVVYLTELHTTMKLGDGRVVDNPRRPGEVAWRDFLKHETENIGEKTAVEIQVEIK